MKPREGGKIFWQSQSENLRKLYIKERKSTKEIGRQYDCDRSTIRRWQHYFEIPVKKIGEDGRPNAVYSVDTHFFDSIDTEEKAYILGYILADGHVASDNHIMFGLHEKDVDILYKIRDSMRTEAPILSKRGKPYKTLDIGSKFMCDVLRNYGFSNTKSKMMDIALIISNVPRYLYRHLIRGMFDGDGSITIYDYPYFKKHSYHLGYTGQSNIVEFVKKEWGLKTKDEDEGNGIVTCRSTCRGDIIRIGHYMYDDATIYMNRKKGTFEKIYALAEIEK